MEFKQWLIEQRGDVDTAIGWDLIYPTQAGDWPRNSLKPKWVWWQQWELERGREIGRDLYNIDPSIIDWEYKSVESTDMPPARHAGFWKHDPKGNNKPQLKIHTSDMDFMKLTKDSTPTIMKGPRIAHTMGQDPPKPETKLCKKFGKCENPYNRHPNVPTDDES